MSELPLLADGRIPKTDREDETGHLSKADAQASH